MIWTLLYSVMLKTVNISQTRLQTSSLADTLLKEKDGALRVFKEGILVLRRAGERDGKIWRQAF